ncbi:MAG: hypothetical protein ACJ76I_06410 [Gaiellaceae bacterium]
MGDERLRQLSPPLADLAAAHDRRQTQLAACRLAVAAAGLDDGHAAAALQALSSGGPDRQFAALSQELADQYDEAAWTAQESGSDTEYESFFRRARAASALACAHRDEASEAIYEAAHALTDTDGFDLALRAALSE